MRWATTREAEGGEGVDCVMGGGGEGTDHHLRLVSLRIQMLQQVSLYEAVGQALLHDSCVWSKVAIRVAVR